jgi:serine O-acetyltransferase
MNQPPLTADQTLSLKIFAKGQDTACVFAGNAGVVDFLKSVLHVLFQGILSQTSYGSPQQVEREIGLLREQLYEALLPFSQKSMSQGDPRNTVHQFFEELPQIYEMLWQDAEAGYLGDPAAESVHEVILAYPGFLAIAVHRIAHVFYRLGVGVFPRIMTEYAHEKTGIDIHPGATIGRAFFMDHGTGIVVGETTTIGDNVKIYQGVTLGALSVKKELGKTKRHPTIEDNVVIYSGATILGGNTIIGHNSVIGGNVWLTESVPPHSVVFHRSVVKVGSRARHPEANDYVI